MALSEQRTKQILQQFQTAGLILQNAILEQLNRLGLGDSRLYKSVEIEVSDEGDILIFANDYAQYVISGRRAGAKPPPIAPLIAWMKRKGISSPDVSINRLAFLIARSISRKGIKPRDFITPAVEATQQELENVVDKIVNDLIDEAVRPFFTKKVN